MTVTPASLRLRHARIRPKPVTLVIAVIVLAAAAFLVVRELTSGSSADVVGSGVWAASVRHLPAFTGVELAATNSVTIHLGGRQRVVVYGDDNLLPLVTTHVENDQLVIDATRGFETRRPMRVDVTQRTLDTVTLAGSGIIRASGSAPHLTATLAGIGHLKLAPLTARDVLAVLVGMGRIDVTATHSLKAVLVGSGAIFYGGNPVHVTKDLEGKGTVTPR